MADARTRISRYLSLHLRHQPERLGLTLQPGGWVLVSDLLAASAEHGVAITRAELDEVVATNDKQRFSFDESGMRIRANQGHSVSVDLDLQPREPPTVLYHGTGARSQAAIERDGLRKMARHHVHLSADQETARRVGARHGQPVIFMVDTTAMRQDGHVFFQSANGVWLTDAVPARYLTLSA
ncbi:MAG TPA: RNA 2'-phosphotransferase [Chloroflexota bacterium]|jgi:putative RNA 2'-phosphotransferase